MPIAISGVVCTYNRADTLESCLAALRFVDELIVVDKSSTDRTSDIARRIADRYVRVAWSPTVEETRALAVGLCSHDWLIIVDDDEVLSPDAAPILRGLIERDQVDVIQIPIRNYILNRHDPRGYYWPEYRNSCFRRGAVEFTSTVHGGVHVTSDRLETLPLDGPVCIHHLSHPDVKTWIEKTNRYTSQEDRSSSFAIDDISSLADFARARLDAWLAKVQERDQYLEAVAILRAVYDIVDGIKIFESAKLTSQPSFSDLGRGLASEVSAADGWRPDFSADWFSANIPYWTEILHRYGISSDEPVVAVEIGCFEGRASRWMLDHVLVHPDSQLHCVDVFPTDDGYWQRFRNNVLRGPHYEKVRVSRGASFEFLADFVARRQRADFMYVDGSHRSPNVLSDLVLAFRALRVGGVIICDDYLGGSGDEPDVTLGSPKLAIDAFTTIFRPYIEILSGQPLYELVFAKRSEMPDDHVESRGGKR